MCIIHRTDLGFFGHLRWKKVINMSNAVVFWNVILRSLHLNGLSVWFLNSLYSAILFMNPWKNTVKFIVCCTCPWGRWLFSSSALCNTAKHSWSALAELWTGEQIPSCHLTLSAFLPTPCALVSNFNMECNFHTVSRLIYSYIVFFAVLFKPAALWYLRFNFNLT